MQLRSWKTLLTAAAAAMLPLSLAVPAAAQATASNPNDWPSSRVDIFAGYSYLKPVHANVGTANEMPALTTGGAVSVAGYFNSVLGAELQGTYHSGDANNCVSTVQGGLIARYQISRLVPFVHALGGGAKAGGPDAQPCGTWGHGYTAGFGFDYGLHAFHEHLAIRPIEADYHYNKVDYGPVAPNFLSGGLLKMNGYSLSAGLVVRFGDTGGREGSSYGAALACSANPDTVNAGDPVTVTSSNTGLNPKRRTTYTWTTTGGKLTGSGDTIQIATEGLAPGTYTVNGRVMQGGRASEQATCRAEFTVNGGPAQGGTQGQVQGQTQTRPGEPPTVSCSAAPSMISPGESATISATARTLSGRPLTCSYSASSGHITGEGPTATLNSGGAQPGEIVVTCTATDSAGATASTTTNVQVVLPQAPPPAATRALCPISFERDKRRPVRVDNEAKGCLDDIAINLQRETDSQLVMVGNNATGESTDAAAERAANAKLYLTREKGIDPARITLRTGQAGDRSVSSTLIPAGATFDDTMSVPVNEGAVPHVGEAYGVPRSTRRTHRR